ncbi:MAG: S9 family peptidase [Chloroflexi bacterium]|nr:S9 family peptidase [Chloroflexota bacterium]
MPSHLEPVKPQDVYQLKWIDEVCFSPDGRFLAYVLATPQQVENNNRRSIWLARVDAAQPPRPFTFGAKADQHPRFSPDGKYLLFVGARSDDPPQLYIIPTDGGEARAITSMFQGAGSPEWRPDGKGVVFLSSVNLAEQAQEDKGESAPAPSDKWEAKRLKEQREHEEALRRDPLVINRLPYRAGTSYLDDRYAQVYVLELDLAGELEEASVPLRLTGGEVDFAMPYWTPDGQAIIAIRQRLPKQDSVFLYTDAVHIAAADGHVTVLDDPGFTVDLAKPSPDGHWVAYTRVDETLPLGMANELVIRPLPVPGMAPGAAKVRSVTGYLDRNVGDFRWSADSRALYTLVNSEGDTYLLRAGLGGETSTVIGGTHQVLCFDVAANSALVFALSTPQNPCELIYATPEGVERQLTDLHGRYLSRHAVAPVEAIHYQAADGWGIQGWIIKPPDFDPGRRYPLIVNIHGGPHVMWGPSFRSIWHDHQAFAAAGYVVFYCNPRGSEGYGSTFQDAIHGNWGEAEMDDILSGVDYLGARGFIDPARMAITGGSYGGYMTVWIIGHDQRFACAAALRGVYHLRAFYGVTDAFELVELEFDGNPWEMDEKLWHHSPLAYAHKIRTPLFISHAELDYRVPISDAEQLYTSIRRNGGTVEFVRYPREGHEMTRSGEPRHRIDNQERLLTWFDRYCKPEKS